MPHTLRRPLLAATFLAGALACGAPEARDGDPPDAAHDAPPVAASLPPGLSTESSTYRFRSDGVTERTAIPFAYHNVGADTLYHPTCRTAEGVPSVTLTLERRDAGDPGGWRMVWVQAVNSCLSDPLVIPPGGVFRDTLEVVLHPQDSVHPETLVPGRDLEGVFRLVWAGLLRSYDPGAYPFGEEIPVADRASPPFGLSR